MTIRVGVVGAGAIAGPHVKAWLALGAEVSVHSLRTPTDFAARYGIAVRTSLGALVADCDLVDVCSPTPTHEDVVLTALAAGRHVVCEKPLARTAATARKLVDAADAAGLLLFPAHVVRYFPEYEELWRRLGAGEVGEVSTAVLTRKVAGPPPGSWFYDEELSGGVAMDLMVHELDQVLWLFGPVRTVAAQWLDGDRRAARATLGHVGGVTSTVEANWGPPDTVFTTSYAVVGSRGRLHHETVGDIETLGDLDSLGGVDVADSRDPYLRQLADVLEHLRTGRPARVTAAEGVAAVALAERVLDQLPSAS